MFLSMTGFGRVSRNFKWGSVTFELTSVNHRYQEIAVRLPQELSSLETRVISLLRTSEVRRGKVRLTAEINWLPEYKNLTLNRELIKSCYEQAKDISEALGLAAPSDIISFLRLPGVCEAPKVLNDDDDESDSAWDMLLKDTISALMEMKKSEGEKLRAIVDKDIKVFEQLLKDLSERWKTASDYAIEALRTRIDKVKEHFNLELDESRLAQEISILSDRWDISEELFRLGAHVVKFRSVASEDELAGRKLDFLIQEINREVNTMGSKVADADFRWLIVEAKSCLERVREQIQNVE